MGTRSLTMIISKKETKIAQYGRLDGYPSGQGLKVLHFLKSCNLNVLKEKVEQLSFFTEKEVKEIYQKFEHEKYPQLKDTVSADILNMVYNNEVYKLEDMENFAADSLFCEWGYVIDLDKNTLEIYRGFQTEPLKENERFYLYQIDIDNILQISKEATLELQEEGWYYPIKMIKEYSLFNLPNTDSFIQELDFINRQMFPKRPIK